ncbi:MAG: GGDEF and EAL domain-containing protein [Candidatus Eremiobacteraeota bacterium]|nr:GGDEF and EAL domain-containing protein [Candidatus Eremiobacteraeota bacterium]
MLVVDSDLRLSTFVAPNGIASQCTDAKRDGQLVQTLSWGNAKRVVTALAGALQGRRQRFFAWKLGSHQFDGYVLPLGDGAEISGAIVVGADCAELFELRDALNQSQKITSSAYFVLDIATMIVNVTPAFARIWGFETETTRIAFEDIMSRVHTEDRAEFDLLIADAGPEHELTLEYRIIHPAGGLRHLRTSGSFLRGKNGSVKRTVGTVVDVTEYVLAQDTAAFLSKHDALTGLNNRSVFIETLQSKTTDTDGKATVVLIDIDHFSQINDIAGHAVGDRLLCAVAERLKFLDQLGHSVARLGGDEFGVLLLEPADALRSNRIIESVRQRLDVPFQIGENQYFLRTTMGVAQYPEDGGGDMLLQNAGIALLSAKGTARGSIARYHPNLERRLIARNRIERDLSHAIDRRQFEMYYQPVIDAGSGEVVAAEALLRWNHPELGLLGPDAFLNVAEESDAVVTIGRWAIDRACRDAMTMTDSLGKPLRLNVNISPRHVQSDALVRDVSWALDRTGWKAHNLQLEMTEQLLMEDTPIASSTLAALCASGITIAIDDFGTGYNTLSYLKVYPVSCIKIDRAFVKDAESDDYSRAICRSVTTLAEALNMNLIGEGVETSGQAAFLRTIGCRELQGYHFGRPVAMGDFIAAHA